MGLGTGGRLFRNYDAINGRSLWGSASSLSLDGQTSRSISIGTHRRYSFRSQDTGNVRPSRTVLMNVLEPGAGDRRTVEREGINVLPVVSEDHVLLAKANGVFPSRDAIELL